MRLSVLAAIISLILAISVAQNEAFKRPDEVKTWKISLAKGGITVTLSSFPRQGQRVDAISIHPYPLSSKVSMSGADGAKAVQNVLREMQPLGYRKTDLSLIFIDSDSVDFRAAMERQVANSGQWRDCVGRMHCYAIAKVMADSFSSSDLNSALDKLLSINGMRISGVSVDEPVVDHRTPTPTPHTEPPQRVLCSGIFRISVAKEKRRNR